MSVLKNWELPCFFLVKPKTPNNGFPDSDGWSMIFLGRLDAFAWNILRHVLITVQYHQKSIALICIDRVSWKSRMHSSKELHPRTSKCQWWQFWCLIPPWPWQIWDLPSYSSVKSRQQTKPLIFWFWVFWVADVQILKPWWKGSTEILWLTVPKRRWWKPRTWHRSALVTRRKNPECCSLRFKS